jgi:ParB family transcriptional regulator, chromosome partitioning protein
MAERNRSAIAQGVPMENGTHETALAQPTLKVRQIVSGQNYRENYDGAAMAKLEETIRAAGGVIEPIIVRPHPESQGVWEIIAGERRWRCARKLYGDDHDLPVTMREATDAQARALGIIENHGRDDPSAIEEAKGAADLLRFNGGDKDSTAKQLGWGVETLERRLLLLTCAPEVQAAIVGRHPHFKLGHAELLAGLPKDRQAMVLAGILEHRVPVEVLKKQLGQFARRLAEAIFDTAPCVGCPHNSAQQAALFDESIGDGFCQHPTHYEELTMAALDARAAPLRERFQIVRFVKAQDGFTPLVLSAEGALGVGAEQALACKGCANFGCAVSAMAGSYGEVTESLCFDAACNSTKVAARRRADRESKTGVGSGSPVETAAQQAAAGDKEGRPAASRPSNTVPPRVVAYRVDLWRKWVANALMAQGERNRRVMTALVLAREVRAVTADRYEEVAVKVAGFKKRDLDPMSMRKMLVQADAFASDKLETLVMAVAASAAYGVSVEDLEALLNYLEVDEARHFVLGENYLELLTVSELESLAEEVGLKKAMGACYAKARAGKRADFIKALLAVEGFVYAGTVPKAMRFQRRRARAASAALGASTAGPADESTDASQSAACS